MKIVFLDKDGNIIDKSAYDVVKDRCGEKVAEEFQMFCETKLGLMVQPLSLKFE